MPSPISSLLTVFVSSDEREGMHFKEEGAGFDVDAGIILCTNKGEADIWGGSSCTERALQMEQLSADHKSTESWCCKK